MNRSDLYRIGRIYLGILLLVVIFVSVFFSKNSTDSHVDSVLLSPTFQHIFGTDSLGRDLFVRTMQGALTSLGIGLFCSLLAMVLGVIYGGISALLGGWIDVLMMRLMEILIATPQMITMGLLILYFSSSGHPSFFQLSLAISLSSWMIFARMTRNLSLREKRLPYVESAIAIGATPLRIFFKSMLPNIAPSILILLGLQLPNYLLFESFLSFLGVGIQSPSSSWGILLQEGWRTMSLYPHLLIFPALLLFLTVLSLNVVFDFFRTQMLRQIEAIDLHQ